MRTTLDLPHALVEEARRVKGRKQVVVLSLQQLERRERLEELTSLCGRDSAASEGAGSHPHPRRPARRP
jgi:hypothetical protein